MIIQTKTGYIHRGAFSRVSGSGVTEDIAVTPEDQRKVCPKCSIRSRHYDNGYLRTYCEPCQKEWRKVAYEKNKELKPKVKKKKPTNAIMGRPRTYVCSRCKVNPKEKPGDRHNHYCTDCRRLLKREYYRKIRQETKNEK